MFHRQIILNRQIMLYRQIASSDYITPSVHFQSNPYDTTHIFSPFPLQVLHSNFCYISAVDFTYHHHLRHSVDKWIMFIIPLFQLLVSSWFVNMLSDTLIVSYCAWDRTKSISSFSMLLKSFIHLLIPEYFPLQFVLLYIIWPIFFGSERFPLRIHHYLKLYLPSYSTYHIFIYLFLSTPYNFIYRLFQLPRIPPAYLLSATISSCIGYFQLNYSLYSIFYLLVGFLFRFQYIVSNLLSVVEIFPHHFLCVFRIPPQSFFSIIFSVSHSRVFPTTGCFCPPEIFPLQRIFFHHHISILLSISSTA